MTNRATRRAQTARVKQQHTRRLRQEQRWGHFDRWTPAQIETYITRMAGIRANTRTLCSCTMCASERKLHGNGHASLTIQERRGHARVHDEE